MNTFLFWKSVGDSWRTVLHYRSTLFRMAVPFWVIYTALYIGVVILGSQELSQATDPASAETPLFRALSQLATLVLSFFGIILNIRLFRYFILQDTAAPSFGGFNRRFFKTIWWGVVMFLLASAVGFVLFLILGPLTVGSLLLSVSGKTHVIAGIVTVLLASFIVISVIFLLVSRLALIYVHIAVEDRKFFFREIWNRTKGFSVKFATGYAVIMLLMVILGGIDGLLGVAVFPSLLSDPHNTMMTPLGVALTYFILMPFLAHYLCTGYCFHGNSPGAQADSTAQNS